jgi:hypothetical protein
MWRWYYKIVKFHFPLNINEFDVYNEFIKSN